MSTKHRNRRTPTPPDAPDPIGEFGSRLLRVDDPLEAELAGAGLLSVRDDDNPRLSELFVAALATNARSNPSPEAAAVLRATAAVAPPALRRILVAALGEVTGAGFYPPEWAARIGRAEPREAWRRCDVFGDVDTIVVTFAYGGAEHAMLVQVDRCRQPTVLQAVVTPQTDQLRSVVDGAGDDPLTDVEPIGLAEARTRLAAALAGEPERAEQAELNETTRISLPVVRSRLRRLPAAGGAATPEYGDSDRAAAVDDFLDSPAAAAAGDGKAARFWAEVFAGYSAYIPGDPPARVGPLKLERMLHWYVPCTRTLTDEQRAGLPAAVTAWTQWAAGRQELAEPANEELTRRLGAALDRFDAAYADPVATASRSYLVDVAATTTDAVRLAEAIRRRALAVPMPAERDPELRSLDATDPAQRRTIVERRYGGSAPPDGISPDGFAAAVVRVCEQLWHDDPPEVWRRARARSDAGEPAGEIIRELAAAG